MKLIHPTNLANFSMLQTDDYDVYFSYETPIALVTEENILISNNHWKQTTGKHINHVKKQYPQHAQVMHRILLDAIDGLQRGNENNDNRYNCEAVTDDELLRRLS